MKTMLSTVAVAAIALAASGPGHAAPTFVNGFTIDGAMFDQSGGTSANNGRVGFFSDLYYDPVRNQWWGVSDRGPGGGTISYDTRVQRFTLDVSPTTGAISNFAIQQTVVFKDQGGTPLNGLAPSPANVLGRSFDPEGFVVLPGSGNFLVSDEYGPSIYEFDRSGNRVRTYTTPANLIPKTSAGTDFNASPTAATTPLISGREGNRGFEGLAVSPDGKYAYAVLQNGTIQDGWSSTSGGTRGQYTRIVKFDTATGEAVAQYAYKLESSGQGRGISAIVALGNDKFLVLERNNRGVGVGATLAGPDKNVYQIDLSVASDVSGISLPATGNLPTGFTPVTKGPKYLDLDANNVLAAALAKSPEKWEGLAVGPQLDDGTFMLLAGTDNDYSVTQSGGSTQYDVYFNFTDTDPYLTSIFCPLDARTGCSNHDSNGNLTTAAPNPGANYALLPGVLHAYKTGAGDFDYVAPVPEPATYALLLLGLCATAAVTRRRIR